MQNKIEYNNQKQLPDVLKELQQIQIKQAKSRQTETKKISTTPYNPIKQRIAYFLSNLKTYILSNKVLNSVLIVLIIVPMVAFLSLSNYIFATNANNKDNEIVKKFEGNANAIDVGDVLSKNLSTTQKKEITIIERDIDYITTYRENSALPKDEKIVVQPGKKGKEQVSIVKIFENDTLIEENDIRNFIIENYIEEIIEVGTSEFLANAKVHLGDTMYLKESTALKASTQDNSTSICTISKNLDVILIEVSGQWCKVLFENRIGYVKSDALTSASINPEIAAANRKTRALLKLSFTMELNKPSGLSLEDFKKILSSESRDANKIIQNHAEAFYNMEQAYNINGIFLSAVAIHESGWGTSTISLDKKNLFGYGAYDRDPYNFSFNFNTYGEGIELISKIFVKYYINPKGTVIYGGETATGDYYNGSNVSGVNIKYASDPEWGVKVYEIMEYLYSKL